MGSLKIFAHVAGDWKPQRTSGILRWCNKGVPTLLGVLPSPAFFYLRSSGWMLHQKKRNVTPEKKEKEFPLLNFGGQAYTWDSLQNLKVVKKFLVFIWKFIREYLSLHNYY